MIDVFFALLAAAANTAGPTQDNLPTGTDSATAEVVAPVEDGTTEGTLSTEGTIATEGTIPTAQTDAPKADTATLQPAPTPSQSVVVGGGVVIGGNTLLEGVQSGAAAPAATPAPLPAPTAARPALNMAVVPAGLVAEPQVPTGKFTTAAEVKPIMSATKGSWIAVREYDGSDLLYVTHIWGWRCGMAAMAISINDEPMQNWPLPDCHLKYATPNAMLEEDGLPYLKLRLGSVQSVTIQVIYDDLTGDVATYQRGDVLIP